MLKAAIVIFILITIVRMVARCVLFKRKLNLRWTWGLVPVYSHILMYTKIGERKNAIIATIARLLGTTILTGVIVHQQYVTAVALTHIYGLILGFYEMPNYDILWNVSTTVGMLLLLFGVVLRLQYAKKMSCLFRANTTSMHFLGMLFPGLHELRLALSKKYKYLLCRDEKDMSREEYQIYLSLIEE